MIQQDLCKYEGGLCWPFKISKKYLLTKRVLMAAVNFKICFIYTDGIA